MPIHSGNHAYMNTHLFIGDVQFTEEATLLTSFINQKCKQLRLEYEGQIHASLILLLLYSVNLTSEFNLQLHKL